MEQTPIRYATGGDVSIAYRTTGDGPRDLIFVPGFVSHLEIMGDLERARKFWERLARSFRLITFDKRGMGLSDRGGGRYTLEGTCEDMLAVLDAVGSESAAVFGVSEGGAAATMFAATHPDRTTALVEFATWARMTRGPDFPEGIPVEDVREFCELMVAGWGDPSLIPRWAPSWRDDSEASEWWARLLRNSSGPGGPANLGQMYEDIDIRPLLDSVGVPALIVWRTEDRVIPPALTRIVAEGIPGAKGVELPGVDHLFLAGDCDAMLGEVEEFLTGRRDTAPVERGLATVLFTDIVESTATAAALGDHRWREILTEHDARAKREIAAERGRLVKSMGDGLLAEFDGPARAISAAQRVRQAILPLDIDIRAGVHTGECERLGDDLGGIAVHIGARVSSAAGAGEVLVSQTVRDLVVGSGLEFEDRGSRELKGVPGEWRLFAVAG